MITMYASRNSAVSQNEKQNRNENSAKQNSDPEPPTQKPPSLTSLPAELHHLIIRHLFPPLIRERITATNWPYPKSRTAIFLVNKALYHVAKYILCHEIPFRVTISDNFIHLLNKIWERYPMSSSYISPFSSLQDPSLQQLARSIRNWDIVLEMQIPHPIFAPWPPEFRIGGVEEKNRLCGLRDSVEKFVGFVERRKVEGDGEWVYNNLRIRVDESIEPAWTAEGAVEGIELVLEPFRKIRGVRDVWLKEDMVRKMVVDGIGPELDARRFEEFRIGFREELRRSETTCIEYEER
ncbi:hypothetical protein BDV96DRAFT_629120 [Lophiotrema nucula]|uniref:F-box domain-containing protein n=1 Tax=Lophiotrema nucula TaxID=690887 RepID=A0A6A5ZJI6_9PLEO|nr:hypothetical protein BDV96DRAFT_629120 [Lophiotrema nucula]